MKSNRGIGLQKLSVYSAKHSNIVVRPSGTTCINPDACGVNNRLSSHKNVISEHISA